MRFICLPICTILFLFSCSKSTEKINKEIVLDSVEMEAQKAKFEKDSIEKVNQNKVIDDIEFGINKKQFDKLNNKFMSKHQGKESYEYSIGGFSFFRGIGMFHEGKLYYYILDGFPIDYSNYNTEMQSQYDIINTMLISKYGMPDYDYGFPKWTDFEKGEGKVCTSWLIGGKTVETIIRSNGVSYELELHSYLHQIQRIVNNIEKEKKSLKIQEGSKSL